MANLFNTIADLFRARRPDNAYNAAVLQYAAGQPVTFDYNRKTYIDAYLNNPDINAIINQIADKTNEVPYYIKRMSDQKSYSERNRLMYATKGNYTPQQLAKKRLLEHKAFEEEEIELGLKKPNPYNTWRELFSLARVFLEADGNIFFYTIKTENGNNAGKLRELYVLPSNLMTIVLKKNANTITDDDPIDYYVLSEGDQMIRFEPKDVFQVRYPNPNFDLAGSQLYGLSKLRAVLKNIESSSAGLSHNVKNMRNGGVFGFFYSEDPDAPLTLDQGKAFKEKLREMENDPGTLSRIAATSIKMGWQRMSLSANDLQVIPQLEFDRKIFANALGWSDKLLNNDAGSTYDNIQQEKKRVLTGAVQSGLLLIQEAFNSYVTPYLPGCDENCVWEWDITEMPEMQADIDKMVKWMKEAYLTPNEIRIATRYETLDIDGMDSVWVASGLKRIDDVGMMPEDFARAFEADDQP